MSLAPTPGSRTPRRLEVEPAAATFARVSSESTISWSDGAPRARESAAEHLALLVAGSTAEPQRVGEVAFAPAGAATLGRGEGEGGPRLRFVRQRPGRNDQTLPLGGAGLSRDQLRVTARGDRLEVELLGKPPLTFLDAEVARCSLRVGDALTVRGQLTLLCVRRPTVLAPLAHFPADASGGFGEPDRFGMLGESPSAWQLREKLAFAAQSNGHVLLWGETGTGKELAARAVHGLSGRAKGAFVARNAATLPGGLIDAELFGHAKNYPDFGMPERAGLIGEADGGSLFLDELAELPQALQSHLLRVLDAEGEYQRLGDPSARRSRFVLVGATNRDPSTLKHDLLARFVVRVQVAALRDHREDLPLLVRHLMQRAMAKSASLVERFFGGPDGEKHPRLDPRLLCALLDHGFDANVRELDALLWQAMSESSGTTVTGSDALLASLRSTPEPAQPLTPEAVKAALDLHGGSVSAAAKALGLKSRYALYRLMKKLAVE